MFEAAHGWHTRVTDNVAGGERRQTFNVSERPAVCVFKQRCVMNRGGVVGQIACLWRRDIGVGSASLERHVLVAKTHRFATRSPSKVAC